MKETTDSKYIQQHLANERTYLAWIRTAIAIIGVGFLIANLHFTFPRTMTKSVSFIANIVEVLSVILGIATIIFSTRNYLQKQHDINEGSFQSPKVFIFFLSSFFIVIIIIFTIYFLL
ncbi:DUF202 domain-containing protein [Cytobacillus sp. IB215665]|uniref:YidH family protein n=1 Tax=Cytobacillus sp. IB215665 TaxID=3097357 RepID=UPI002A0CF189|nr:DUF202 domain-containing protein [Cytobacillus sp. IB215665]MDX8367429.1 DUF202 domain-containing protein [Cytobacillus sp. IB215665]